MDPLGNAKPGRRGFRSGGRQSLILLMAGDLTTVERRGGPWAGTFDSSWPILIPQGPRSRPQLSSGMKVVSINVGLPREVQWHGKTVVTSIFKPPVEGSVKVRRLNFEGDRQSDLAVHGGADKAAYVYPAGHDAFWRAELPGVDLPWGAFGENFTTEGLIEDAVHIGDRFRIGSAEFAVTQPRMPCFKLGIRFGRPDRLLSGRDPGGRSRGRRCRRFDRPERACDQRRRDRRPVLGGRREPGSSAQGKRTFRASRGLAGLLSQAPLGTGCVIGQGNDRGPRADCRWYPRHE